MDSLKKLFQGSALEKIPTYLMYVDYTGGNCVFTQLRELSKFHRRNLSGVAKLIEKLIHTFYWTSTF